MDDGQTEDLRAFESRLRECVVYFKRRSLKWKIILLAVCVWTAIATWNCFCDSTVYNSYVERLWAHKSLTISCIALFILYFLGIGEKYNAGQVIAYRSRSVLSDYNMSCDDSGKLILKKSRTQDRWRPR